MITYNNNKKIMYAQLENGVKMATAINQSDDVCLAIDC